MSWRQLLQHSTLLQPSGRPSKKAVNAIQGAPKWCHWKVTSWIHSAPEHCSLVAVMYLHWFLHSFCQIVWQLERLFIPWWSDAIPKQWVFTYNTQCFFTLRESEHIVLVQPSASGRILDAWLIFTVLLKKWTYCGVMLHKTPSCFSIHSCGLRFTKKTCQCSGQKPSAEDLCKKLGLVLVLVQACKVLSLFKAVPPGDQLLC